MITTILAISVAISINIQGLSDCPEGPLRGVKVGTPLFQEQVWKLPNHACIAHGPNGSFIVTIYGVDRMSK